MRRLTAAAVAGLALAGLAGCRTAPNVAAYVGDERVTVAELEAAVDERLADETLAATAGADRAEYTRSVLTSLVDDAVHAEVAQDYGVEVTDREVSERIELLLDGQDAEAAFDQLAAQGLSRQDVRASVRRELVRLAVAREAGLAEGLEEPALRQRYEQARAESTEIEFGYITVPDQATADSVVSALQADPARYEELAAANAGDYTLPAVETRTPQEIPGPLAEQAAAAQPGTAFSVPVEETGGIVVGFVAAYPTFEEQRSRLELQAGSEIDEDVRPLVQEFRADLEVVVNPRYGELREGEGGPEVAPVGDGFIDILTDQG